MKGIYYRLLSTTESNEFYNENVIEELVVGDKVWIKCLKDSDAPEQPKKEQPSQESEGYYLVGSDELKVKESQVIHIERNYQNEAVFPSFEKTLPSKFNTSIQDSHHIINYFNDEGLPCEITTRKFVYCPKGSDSQNSKFPDFKDYWVQTVNHQINEIRSKKEEK